MTRPWIVVFRSKSGQLMRYQGRKFSNKGKALRFSTIDHATRVARALMRKFPDALTKGTLFIEKARATNMTVLKTNPRKSRRKYKKNPSGYRTSIDAYARELDEADERLAGFSGRSSKTVLKVQAPQIRTGLVIGKLLGVMYSTTRDGVRENYKHEFDRKSQPLLIASHDGKQIGIVGGRYQFTDAGIEDE